MPPRTIEMIFRARAEGLEAFDRASAKLRELQSAARRTEKAGLTDDSARLRDMAHWKGMEKADLAEQLSGRRALAGRLAAFKAANEEQVASARSAAAARRELSAREAAEAPAASQARSKAAAADAALRTDLESRYFSATHTRREVDLRNLQQYYARLRQQHAGNAAMLAQIDRTYAAEARKLLLTPAPGAAGVPAAGGGGGFFDIFGGKRMAKREMKYAAATMMGMHGGEVGLMTSALVSMSLPIAAFVGGLAMVGSAMTAASDTAKAYAATQAEAARSARETLAAQRSLLPSLNSQTGQRLEDLQQKALDAREAAIGRMPERPNWIGGTSLAIAWQKFRRPNGRSDWENNANAIVAEANRQTELAELYRGAGRQEAIAQSQLTGVEIAHRAARLELSGREPSEQKRYDEWRVDQQMREMKLQAERASELRILQLRKDSGENGLAAEEAQRKKNYEAAVAYNQRLRAISDSEHQDLLAKEGLRQNYDATAGQLDLRQRMANLSDDVNQRERDSLRIAHEREMAQLAVNQATEDQRKSVEAVQKAEKAHLADTQRKRQAAARETAGYATLEALAAARGGAEVDEQVRKLRNASELHQARGAGKDAYETAMIEARQLFHQAAEMRARSQQTSSAPVIERGFLTRVPGQYRPFAGLEAKSEALIKQGIKLLKETEGANKLLEKIAKNTGVAPLAISF